jgi:8-oxo-dGTP pyrophosphatase MutT (NUDIX family)
MDGVAEPEAAVAIVHARGPVDSVLLMRRAEREDDPWSGHWSLPGGKRHADDPDLVHTAIRELAEECGIRIGPELMEAALAPKVARRRTGPYVLVAPFVFVMAAELPAVADGREAVEARWVPLSRLRDPAAHRLQPVPKWPPTALYPAVDLYGTPLWGFTYWLLADWLGLVKPGATEQAGYEAGNRVLAFLAERGVPVVRGWTDRVAVVKGRIPDEALRARFSDPGGEMPQVNLLEASPDRVRIVDLRFEEYLIQAMDGS